MKKILYAILFFCALFTVCQFTYQMITSQLFVPGAAQNESDSIYNKSLLMEVSDNNGSKIATFNFVVNK